MLFVPDHYWCVMIMPSIPRIVHTPLKHLPAFWPLCKLNIPTYLGLLILGTFSMPFASSSNMAPAASIVVCFTLLAIAKALFAHGEEFHPITENVALKASYKLEVFTGNNLDSVTELQEEYQFNLAASRIELRRQEFDDNGRPAAEIDVRNYLYDAVNRLDVELIGQHQEANSASSRFHLEENGGSSSYVYHSARATADTSRVRVLTSSESVGDIIFSWNSSNTTNQRETHLDLDSFLTTECAQRVHSKLGHIRGITKLLHLIECRRKNFILDHRGQNEAEQPARTRGIDKNIYRATYLPALTEFRENYIHWLNVSVSVIEQLQPMPTYQHDVDRCLAERLLPTSLSLEFGQVTMIINVYQLEATSAGAHLSESATSESDFLMPIASGMDLLLGSAIAGNQQFGPVWGKGRGDGSTKLTATKEQFSFRAALTGSRIPLADPVELFVAYDGFTRQLARQMAVVDRGRLLGDSWQRLVTRMVYDGESKLKFHLMKWMDDYVQPIDHHPNGKSDADDDDDESNWTDCSSDILSGQEEEALEMGGMESFDLEGAVYMGMALVRGIPCLVYERRLYRLPFWMGFGYGFEFSNLNPMTRSKIHATIYVAAGEIAAAAAGASNGEPQPSSTTSARNSGSQRGGIRGKLHRLVITVAPATNSSAARLHYNLEVFNFDWSIRLADQQLPGLLSVGQECLFSRAGARYLQMNLRMEPQELQEQKSEVATNANYSTSFKLLSQLRDDESLQVESIARALSQSLGIAQSQQADLETSQGSDMSLEAKLNVYELPSNQINTKFLGYAKDLSVGSALTGGWSVGVASITLEECLWRTVHTLRPPQAIVSSRSENSSSSHPGSKRTFMYCPTTLHCVLADGSRWDKLESLEPTTINSVLQYPDTRQQQQQQQQQAAGNPNKCSLFMVELTTQQQQQRAEGHGGIGDISAGGISLDWMLSQRVRLQDSLVHLEDSRGDLDSVFMKISQLKLSSIVETGEASGRHLSEPIKGLAYEHEPHYKQGQFLLIVPSVAHCSWACFVHHDCESYSICHHGLQFECQLTKVNWTEPIKVAELQELATFPITSMGDKSRKVVVWEVQLPDGQSNAEIKLRRSNLCSMFSRKHLNLFMPLDGSTNWLVQNSDTLLSSKSSAECARFCLDRASLLASLYHDVDDDDDLSARGNEPWKPLPLAKGQEVRLNGRQCTSFRYSPLEGTCHLLPEHKLDRLANQHANHRALDGTLLAHLNEWQQSLEAMESRRPLISRQHLVVDTYGLDYEQLFVVHPDQRITVLTGATDGETDEWQEIFINTGFHECAEHCLERFACKSFDLVSKSTVAEYNRQDWDYAAGSRMNTCILNAFSLTDLSYSDDNDDNGGRARGEREIFTLEKRKLNSKDSGSDDKWWHYEFNELALYASGKLPRIGDDPSEDLKSEDDIFINHSGNLVAQNGWRSRNESKMKTSSAPNLFRPILLGMLLAIALLLTVGGLLFHSSHFFRRKTRNIFHDTLGLLPLRR